MNKSPNYLWETLVMIASFGLLWVWFFANRSGTVSLVIHGLLAISVIALVVIFVRRLRRVRDAMNETQKTPGLPFMPPGFGDMQNGNRSNGTPNGVHKNGTNGRYKNRDSQSKN